MSTEQRHCPQVEDLSAWLDAELPAAEAATVEAHVADCASCQSLVERLGGASAALRALPRPAATPELVGRVVATVAAAPRQRRRPAFAAAAIAAATLAAALLVFHFAERQAASPSVASSADRREVAAPALAPGEPSAAPAAAAVGKLADDKADAGRMDAGDGLAPFAEHQAQAEVADEFREAPAKMEAFVPRDAPGQRNVRANELSTPSLSSPPAEAGWKVQQQASGELKDAGSDADVMASDIAKKARKEDAEADFHARAAGASQAATETASNGPALGGRARQAPAAVGGAASGFIDTHVPQPPARPDAANEEAEGQVAGMAPQQAAAATMPALPCLPASGGPAQASPLAVAAGSLVLPPWMSFLPAPAAAPPPVDAEPITVDFVLAADGSVARRDIAGAAASARPFLAALIPALASARPATCAGQPVAVAARVRFRPEAAGWRGELIGAGR